MKKKEKVAWLSSRIISQDNEFEFSNIYLYYNYIKTINITLEYWLY